jgi:hypothetical protein
MSTAAGDPFGEDGNARLRARVSVLGADFVVTSSARSLLDLAIEAFAGMPAHRLERRPPRLTAQLVLNDRPPTWARGAAPPPPVLSSGAGLLCATVDAGNFAVVDAGMSRALISISEAMLEQRYYARYELVELAFLTLATRVQGLVPLHAACLGANGDALLVIGGSGTGKSTLCLHALADGLQLLGEDSAFVAPGSLRVTGLPSYLHLIRDSLRFVRSPALRRAIERSPVIQRRSGARKLEVDVRKLPTAGSGKAFRIVATVFLSRRPAGPARAWRALDRSTCLSRLRREQPYAIRRSVDWEAFERRIGKLPAYELRRTEPAVAVRHLRGLL